MLFCQAVAEDYNEPEEDGEKQTCLLFLFVLIFVTSDLTTVSAVDSLVVLDQSL